MTGRLDMYDWKIKTVLLINVVIYCSVEGLWVKGTSPLSCHHSLEKNRGDCRVCGKRAGEEIALDEHMGEVHSGLV